MSSMESLDRLQAELSGNVYGDAFHTLYKLSQDVSVEHSELMSQAMKWVHKEKVEPLEAENAKLREQVRWLKKGDILHVLTDQEYIDQCERERLAQASIDALDDENAKLRELATLMYTYHHGDCYSCKWHDECCNELVEWKCIAPERIDEMACELGIEVTA